MSRIPTPRITIVAVLVPYILLVPPILAARAWMEAPSHSVETSTVMARFSVLDAARSFFVREDSDKTVNHAQFRRMKRHVQGADFLYDGEGYGC